MLFTHMLVLNVTFSMNIIITNLMEYHPQSGAPYPPDPILRGEQRTSYIDPNVTILPWDEHE